MLLEIPQSQILHKLGTTEDSLVFLCCLRSFCHKYFTNLELQKTVLFFYAAWDPLVTNTSQTWNYGRQSCFSMLHEIPQWQILHKLGTTEDSLVFLCCLRSFCHKYFTNLELQKTVLFFYAAWDPSVTNTSQTWNYRRQSCFLFVDFFKHLVYSVVWVNGCRGATCYDHRVKLWIYICSAATVQKQQQWRQKLGTQKIRSLIPFLQSSNGSSMQQRCRIFFSLHEAVKKKKSTTVPHTAFVFLCAQSLLFKLSLTPHFCTTTTLFLHCMYPTITHGGTWGWKAFKRTHTDTHTNKHTHTHTHTHTNTQRA